MRVPRTSAPANAPDTADTPDAVDGDSADHSIVTGDHRVLRPGAHPETLLPRMVERDAPDERRKHEDGAEPRREKQPRKRRRPPPPPDLPGARDELVGADERPLLARAPTIALDPGPTAEPGDLTLTDPELARAALRTPHAYAKHCMILAEAFRRATGATRPEGLAYLARLLVAVSDPAFGHAALRELGPATGIIDLYPLELLEHVIDHYPGFLPKVARGRFVRRSLDDESFTLDTDRPLVLEYREELKVRGFAIIGGARPGYRFEPAGPGAYHLSIDTPGRYTCAVSCLSKTGQVVIDRLELLVRPGVRPPPAPRAESELPPRDPDLVAAWPIPSLPAARREDPLSPSERRRRELESRFTAEELAHRLGVLGLANLRARASARRAAAVHEETQPSWAVAAPIELDDESPAPRRSAPEPGAARRPGATTAARPSAAPPPRVSDADRPPRPRVRPEAPRATPRSSEPPPPRARAGREGRAERASRGPQPDLVAAQALLARDAGVQAARRGGPLVAAPRLAAPDASDASEVLEGDEPTSALDDPDPTRRIDLSPEEALAPDAVLLRSDATAPLDRARLARILEGPPPEPRTRPIVVDPLRATSRQPVEDDEPGDHTLTELDD